MSNLDEGMAPGVACDLLGQITTTPAHLSTRSRQWTSLCFVSLACLISAGPVGAFPTLEPLYVSNHLFNGDTSQLANAYSLGGSALCIAAFPAGLFYDKFGGRAAGMFGAFLTAIALLLMAFSLYKAPSFGWVFSVGYPLAIAAGYWNATALFPFLWIFPDRQSFVSGVFSATGFLSTLLAYVAVSLNNAYGLRVQSLFTILAAACTITFVVCYLFVPSRALTLAKSCDLVGSEGIARSTLRTQFGEAWRCLVNHRLISSTFVCYNIAFYMSFVVISGYLLPYYGTLFSDADTASLCDAFAIMYGVGSGACALLGGWLCDIVGIVWFTISQVLVVGLTMTCIATPSVWVQYLAQLLIAISMGQYLVMSVRFCSLYSTPDCFGTYTGIINVAMALSSLLLSGIVNKALQSSTSTDSFRIAFLITLALVFVFGSVLVATWCRRPPPSADKR